MSPTNSSSIIQLHVYNHGSQIEADSMPI